MAFNVKVFGYRGFKQVPTVLPQQHFTSEHFGFWHPYEWRQNINTIDGANPVTIGPAGIVNDQTKLIYVELPAGAAIRYEVVTPGSPRVADANSPLMAASDWLPFEAGFALSMVEAV